jgi:hypothetical protein
MITFLVNSLYLLAFLLSVSGLIYYFYAYRALPDEEALRKEDDLRIAARNETRAYHSHTSSQKRGLARY